MPTLVSFTFENEKKKEKKAEKRKKNIISFRGQKCIYMYINMYI